MGHYRGSKECPKTPLSARIYALGIGAEMGEDTSPDGHDKEEEVPFEGLEFDGDTDIEFTDLESDDNIGSGAIVANFHIVSESGNEVDIAQVAQLATTGETKCDQKIANKLVSSIKEQYETRGSGIKTPFRGPSAKQLKANEQQTWASNANSKPNMTKGPHQKVQIRCCPTAVLKVNGVDAFVYFDSGSELDTISPDFAWALGIKPTTKDASIKVCLATKGSTSTTSYEVKVNIAADAVALFKEITVDIAKKSLMKIRDISWITPLRITDIGWITPLRNLDITTAGLPTGTGWAVQIGLGPFIIAHSILAIHRARPSLHCPATAGTASDHTGRQRFP
jgi:hypothetical protein